MCFNKGNLLHEGAGLKLQDVKGQKNKSNKNAEQKKDDNKRKNIKIIPSQMKLNQCQRNKKWPHMRVTPVVQNWGKTKHGEQNNTPAKPSKPPKSIQPIIPASNVSSESRQMQSNSTQKGYQMPKT